jgi:chromate transporter
MIFNLVFATKASQYSNLVIMSIKKELLEIAKLFFKLGSIAFGGPAAHIAMMEDEVVKKRKWMTQEHFLDLVGATNLIPGPNSTEMTMHCGYERAGWKGLFVAGFCFIFPAVVITSIFAWLYQEYGQLPKVEPFIYGIKPAVIAIIIIAAFRLGKKAVKNIELAISGVLTLVACLFGSNEIIALFGYGLLVRSGIRGSLR